jgi:hypothetical protein
MCASTASAPTGPRAGGPRAPRPRSVTPAAPREPWRGPDAQQLTNAGLAYLGKWSCSAKRMAEVLQRRVKRIERRVGRALLDEAMLRQIDEVRRVFSAITDRPVIARARRWWSA